jgi:hypothetical protein
VVFSPRLVVAATIDPVSVTSISNIGPATRLSSSSVHLAGNIGHEPAERVEPAWYATACHWVEEHVLDADVFHLPDRIDHLVGRSANGLRWLHDCVGIEIDPKRQCDFVGVSTFDLAGSSNIRPFLGDDVERLEGGVESVTKLGSASKGRPACAADPNRYRVLDWFRLEPNGWELVKLAVVARVFFCEQSIEDLELLIGAFASLIPRHAQHFGFLLHPPKIRRPFDNTSIVASCLAVTTGNRYGKMSTVMPRRRFSVHAATNCSVPRGSSQPMSGVAGNDPSAVYGYFEFTSAGQQT